MAEATQATQDVEHGKDIDQARIMLGLLDSVERDGGQSQRRLASELGIALGLVNAYLKRCVKKGLLKVNQAPARRYVYYLTPQGFAEKSRLTVEYLSYSLRFFRQAKGDCAALLQAARGRGLTRVAFAGKSDLAEIAVICALDAGITIVAVVDPEASEGRFVGAPLAASWEAVSEPFDAVVVTDLMSTRKTCEAVLTKFGPERTLVPALLHQRLRHREEQPS
jgi:DNA-binding MarR family transcriptional regulator